MKKITIAIDGYSSCGKSTMAKGLAKEIGYVYVDTGAMYRAVTLFAIRNGLFNADKSVNESGIEAHLNDIKISFRRNEADGQMVTCLNGEPVETEIRSMQVAELVSRIAALPAVRKALVEQQRSMGKEKGVVMDGRDIGTAVFPDAELKVFVTASPEVRAKRRYDEMKAKGKDADFNAILENVKERDYIDSHREVSPLRKADDAIVLDNTTMTIDEQKAWLMAKYIKAATE